MTLTSEWTVLRTLWGKYKSLPNNCFSASLLMFRKRLAAGFPHPYELEIRGCVTEWKSWRHEMYIMMCFMMWTYYVDWHDTSGLQVTSVNSNVWNFCFLLIAHRMLRGAAGGPSGSCTSPCSSAVWVREREHIPVLIISPVTETALYTGLFHCTSI